VILKLQRFIEHRESTVGQLFINDYPHFYTLEQNWENNNRNVSCIPGDEYSMVLYYSERHGRTYKIMGVPMRDGIIFHSGNTSKDTKGCVLLGLRYDKSERMVTSSKKAMIKFMDLMNFIPAARIEIFNIHGFKYDEEYNNAKSI